MRKLTFLLMLLCLNIIVDKAKAKEVVDAYVDFSTKSSVDFAVWGGGDRLSIVYGCLHYHGEEATANPWDVQFIPVTYDAEVGRTYFVSFKFKGTAGQPVYNCAFGGVDKYAPFEVTGDWQTITLKYRVTDASKGSFLFQCGTFIGDWDIAYFKITHDDEPERPKEWAETISNGDAEADWDYPNLKYDDLENNYKICVWTKEEGVNTNENGVSEPHPAEIVNIDGGRSFICRAVADDTKDDGGWANQLWLQSPHAWKSDEPFKLSFRYKASQVAYTTTQFYGKKPLDYITWNAIGDITFSTEWQTFEKVIYVPTEANGMWSIGFNLNADVKTPVDFYIDDLSWSEVIFNDWPELPEQTQATGIKYWVDDDTRSLQASTKLDDTFTYDVSTMASGLHVFHCQIIDNNGFAGIPYSTMFIKLDQSLKDNNVEIAKQRYWFDRDTTSIHESEFTNGIQTIDVSALADGEHTLNLQVVDDAGRVSEVVTATFIKEGGDIRILIVKRHYTDEDIAKAQQNPNILVVKWENGETLPLSIRDGMNPNLITYVEDGVEIEGGFKNSRNVVQNGKANELVLTDRSPLLITEPFTASKAQYTRHFEKETTIGDAAGWESIVLPYPVQKITTEDGRALAPFGSPIPADVNFWLGRMVNDGFEHATKILANVPYVIAVPNSNSYRDEYNVAGNVHFTSTSVKVHATDEETANYSIFKPTYEEVADYADLYAINDDEYDTHPAGSVFVRGLRAIRPFEGYITKDFVGGAAPRTIIPIMSNDETGIVDVTRKPDNGKVYTIDGRRVNSKTLSAGLYIINGRKVVVK